MPPLRQLFLRAAIIFNISSVRERLSDSVSHMETAVLPSHEAYAGLDSDGWVLPESIDKRNIANLSTHIYIFVLVL